MKLTLVTMVMKKENPKHMQLAIGGLSNGISREEMSKEEMNKEEMSKEVSTRCSVCEGPVAEWGLSCHQCGCLLCQKCEEKIPLNWGPICSEICLLEND